MAAPADPDGAQEPDDAEALAEARRLTTQDVSFVKGVVDLGALPGGALPEIAFAGRSNVGKSSLINALTQRRTLARTSNTPGRTQELNVFDMGGRLLMIDMPGYGFAKAPKAKVEAWTRLVRLYLRGRPQLRRVFLLIDARHGVKANDREIMGMLNEAAVSYQVVLTKIDKLKGTDQARVLAETEAEARRNPAAYPVVLATSSEKGAGIDALRLAIAELAREGA
ncbi:ribosome biogenesis GTP-binding protein YihA/YsxC [Futiania mangrovi]|uniref:Probable GTP-binding protein EngB n=1 Tax=Futiania mangrovi TaxID=2959716 RepID=A0A9J6PEC2_9PROT|nr:ribosome biogenesis GTP-binding protein YihA/YsxC [Futiania mangrovii]MCP1337765.1 ribosome biogenesis GTP-binding protein YihA/YsxC [Futiania mangrovii]